MVDEEIYLKKQLTGIGLAFIQIANNKPKVCRGCGEKYIKTVKSPNRCLKCFYKKLK